jgi:hypothetical protein
VPVKLHADIAEWVHSDVTGEVCAAADVESEFEFPSLQDAKTAGSRVSTARRSASVFFIIILPFEETRVFGKPTH